MNWSKKSRLFLIVLLAIILIIPMMPRGMADGYGEASESLGQFVDDYENANNVSVTVNVINNQTLDCMELNYSGICEDFTSYTEVDEDGDVTVTFNLVSWVTMRRDANTYLWKDFGAGYFEDFEYEISLNMTDVDAGDISAPIALSLIVLANSTAKIKTLQATHWLGVYLSQDADNDDKFHIGMRERKSGGNVFSLDTGIVYDVNEARYITFNRSGNDVGLYVFEDEARTILDGFCTGIGNGDNYRYIHAFSNAGVIVPDQADHTTGKIWDLALGALGYESSGYFITEDYLNYTTGQSLTLLTNTSLPGSTSITAQFSEDNLTWLNNKGNVGSNTLDAGFFALDLRELNYTDCFIRYNFTGPGDSTPRLYQSRLISTEGPPAPPVDDYFIIFLAIGLILMLAIAFLYTRDK